MVSLKSACQSVQVGSCSRLVAGWAINTADCVDLANSKREVLCTWWVCMVSNAT